MAERVLMVAFHFPPIRGSSGYLRTLKFVRYLPDHGIRPAVLTVSPRAYQETDGPVPGQAPGEAIVRRSFALDTRKHLALRGRYPRFLALPDRYMTWIPFGVWDGLRLIRRQRLQAIFSTYPVVSAHVIGGILARLTGLPWIADFRDPMFDDAYAYESDGERKARASIEKWVMRRATRVLTVTPSMETVFRQRYPFVPPGKIEVIPNGFDEADFAGLAPAPAGGAMPATLIHAGLLDREDRNPTAFFRALRILSDQGRIRPGSVRIRLLASGNDADYAKEIASLGLEGLVFLEKGMPYAQALQAMAQADILLLFQGPSCDPQIPAKLYEYMRIGKPILAMATERGETGRFIRSAGAGEVIPIEDAEAIARGLAEWLDASASGRALPAASRAMASGFSRQAQAGRLAEILRGL